MQHHLVKIIASESELKEIGIHQWSRNKLLEPNKLFRCYRHKTTKGEVMYYFDDEQINMSKDGILWVTDRMVKIVEDCK